MPKYGRSWREVVQSLDLSAAEAPQLLIYMLSYIVDKEHLVLRPPINGEYVTYITYLLFKIMKMNNLVFHFILFYI